MITKIVKIKGDWEEVVNDCRTTVGKGELGKEPSQKFKREILISEHSPIRSITVKWTVTGNTEHVEKYQVYKSTKAQKGYKKSITTTKTSFKNTKNLTKGTRYYYKVRAIGVVDGVTYYSDWSNKANRIAK